MPYMNCICFSFRSFSWQTKAMVDACMRAYEIVMTKTRKMLEAAFSCSYNSFGIGHGLFVTENLSLGSPVASLIMDSYMY